MQDLAFDAAQAALAAVSNHHLHKLPSEPATLVIRTDNNGIFGGIVGGVVVQPHHREQFAGCLVERHEGHGAGVIEMREILD